MNAVVFDTHAFVKRLTAVGMPEAQAEVLADEQARLIDERLATKSDVRESEQKLTAGLRELEQKLTAGLRELEQKLTAGLRETELRLETKMEAMRADSLRWVLGAIGLQTLALLGAVVALVRALH